MSLNLIWVLINLQSKEILMLISLLDAYFHLLPAIRYFLIKSFEFSFQWPIEVHDYLEFIECFSQLVHCSLNLLISCFCSFLNLRLELQIILSEFLKLFFELTLINRLRLVHLVNLQFYTIVLLIQLPVQIEPYSRYRLFDLHLQCYFEFLCILHCVFSRRASLALLKRE